MDRNLEDEMLAELMNSPEVQKVLEQMYLEEIAAMEREMLEREYNQQEEDENAA